MYQPIKAELARALRPAGCRSGAIGSGWGSRSSPRVTSRRFIRPTGCSTGSGTFATAYRLAMWLHWLALAAATFAYARGLGISRAGAALAAVSFTLVRLPGGARRS